MCSHLAQKPIASKSLIFGYCLIDPEKEKALFARHVKIAGRAQQFSVHLVVYPFTSFNYKSLNNPFKTCLTNIQLCSMPG